MARANNLVRASCPICPATFARKDGLVRHTQSVHGDASFACSFCELTFKRSDALSNHLRSHSAGGRLCLYKDCNTRHRDAKALANHVEAVHRKQTFPCSRCDYVGINRKCLNRHRGIHEELAYTCKEQHCNFETHRRDILTQHMQVHQRGEGYSCVDCSYVGNQRASLYIHRRTHHQPPQFACEQCGRLFPHKQQMMAHERTAHFFNLQSRKRGRFERRILEVLCDAGIKHETEKFFQLSDTEACRVDIVINRDRYVVLLEIDEFQHTDITSYKIDKESNRPLRLKALYPDKFVSFIRFNPNTFRINNIVQRVPIERRHQLLLDVINREPIGALEVTYLFYNRDLEMQLEVTKQSGFNAELLKYII